MNSDFPRIITLLRKERNISQKQAAADLGISQALLSHYEKGIRECGLDFLVRIADYYDVSCDYLLGRSPEPMGRMISYNPPSEDGDAGINENTDKEKNLFINSAEVVYSLAQKTGSTSLIKAVSSYMLLALYRMFRIIYSANPKNDVRLFAVPESASDGMADAAMSVSCAVAASAAKGTAIGNGDKVKESDDTIITTNSLSSDYPEKAPAILGTIKESEDQILSLMQSVSEDNTVNQ